RDVEHFLKEEAVEAGPPTASYRVRKFLRRNKAKVLAATLLLLTLVAGLTGTTMAMLRAVTAREDARSEADRASRAEDLAKDRLAEVDRQREKIAAAEKQARNEADIFTGALAFMQMAVGKSDLKG